MLVPGAAEHPQPATIRLDQFLKLTGLVSTGGQAKLCIQAGDVRVNGEVELRRSRKLVAGDEVCCGDHVFEVGDA